MHLDLKNLMSLLVPVFWLVLGAGVVEAKEHNEIQAVDTSSPRDTLRSFIEASNEINELIRKERILNRRSPQYARNAARIIDCIDISEIPAFAREHRAAEVAVYIKEILDRHDLPDWEGIPDQEAIEEAGGFEQLSVWRIPGTRLTIARVEEGP